MTRPSPPVAPATSAGTPAPQADALTRALRRLSPACRDHASLPVERAFDWDEALADVREIRVRLVVLRSLRRVGPDLALLAELEDDRARSRAASAPGFLHYVKGFESATREGVSLCLLRKARAAVTPPFPVSAQAVRELYDSFEWEHYEVRKGGAMGEDCTFKRIEDREQEARVWQR